MTFQQRVSALVQLGQVFAEKAAQTDDPMIHQAYLQNPWFTPDNTCMALRAWSSQLSAFELDRWLSAYAIDGVQPKQVAIIMAGNIPLVGLHDLICVLVAGHRALVKLSTDDTVLMKWVIAELIRIEPALGDAISISESRLPQGFDAVIATGSNNTNRYFEYYFRNKPSLLRGSRTSVAVISGNETPEDFQKLGRDIFTYFGLGCRNVSKIYIPETFELSVFFEGIQSFENVVYHHKYANNYTYHKAIFLMNQTVHLDNLFLLVKEDTHIASPLGVLFYERYKTLEDVTQTLQTAASSIQCVVSKVQLPGAVPLGEAQQPQLTDYADGVDTLAFLLALA